MKVHIRRSSPLALVLALAATLALACGGKPAATTAAGGSAADGRRGGAATGADAPLPVDPAIRVGTLPNGLTYYVRAHHRPEKRALLWLAVDAGSVLEDDDQRGLAHFVEHMAFNGTRRFEKSQIVNFLESIGMKFGPDLNAYTSFDETVYQITVPTDDAKVVAKALDVLEDWAAGISFDATEVDKERGVVLEEWRLGQGAFQRLFDKQFPVMFQGSQYANRLPIGKPEILKKAPVAALTRFYRDWYRPDLMAVVAVGDFDPAAMEKAIKERFGKLAGPAKPRPREATAVPAHDATLVSIETDPEMPTTAVSIVTKLPLRPKSSARDYRRLILEQLYHGMLNQRLGELARDAATPFTGAGSGTGGFVRSADAFTLIAQAKEGRVAETIDALLTEVERVDRHGFTATELERVKAATLRSYRRSLEERDKVDSRQYAAEIVRHFLQDEMMPGIAAELKLVEDMLPGIGLDELNKLAREWITERNRVIVVSGPAKAKMPTRDEVLAVVRSVAGKNVVAYEDRTSSSPIMAAPPRPGSIAKTATLAELDVTVWTLSNGARVVVKPTTFKNDEVQMSGFSPGGHSLAKDADYLSARHAAAVTNLGGVGEHSDTVLGKLLAGKVAGASAWIDELEEGVAANASPKDLETMFQLVHLRFTAPRRDPDAFAAWKARQIEAVKNREVDPQQTFFDQVSKVASNNHRRRQPLTVDMVDKIDLDRAIEFYRTRFADAGDFTFVIVGNVDIERLRPLVETYLASLPVKKRKDRWRDVGVRPPAGKKTVRVSKGSEPRSQVSMIFHADHKWSRDSQDDLRMLGEVLQIRLREVLREDMGGVYGVGAGGDISRRPRQRFQFSVGFGCAPDNVDKLKAAVLDVIAQVKKSGADDATLGKVRELRRRKLETDAKENGYWLARLSEHYRYGTDPKLILDEPKLAERVSSARVQAAARKFLAGKNVIDAVLVPAK